MTGIPQRVRLEFRGIDQSTQQLGTDDEHMLVVVYLRAVANDRAVDGVAHVKQSVGSRYGEGEFECSVSVPGFAPGRPIVEAIRRYLYAVVGASGRAIQVGPNSGITMTNNRFEIPWTIDVYMSAVGEGGGGW